MLNTPAIDVILAGVENRPDATLGELLNFMTAFNLRFGVASTPQQRRDLQRPLSQARATAQPGRPGPGTSAAPRASGTEAEDFFSVMSYEDLQKKAPKTESGRSQPKP